MIGGLLAGAMAGGAEAAQDNARTRIKKMHDEAMQRMQQKFASSERQAGQQFSREERVAGQDFTSGENVANRGHDMTLAQMREQGANSRSGAQISAADRRAREGAGQIVPLEGGGYGNYNPITNSVTPLPDNVAYQGSTDLTGRQQAQLDMLNEQAKPLRKKMAEGMEPLTADEKVRLGSIEAQQQQLIGGSSSQGMTPFQQLQQGEGGQQEETSAPDNSVLGMARREQEDRQNAQSTNQAASEVKRETTEVRDAADAVLDRIKREQAGGASSGGLLSGINRAAGKGQVSQEAIAEAQQIAQRIISFDQNTSLSATQKRWLSERLTRLQDAGVPLKLDQ